MHAKPKLSFAEQVEHLAGKGITFEHFNRDDAARYLEENNNLFKLSSYRKNFEKKPNGQYIRLDFGHLVDLAIIDSRLRMVVMEMALNIEHFAKVRLLGKITRDASEDGYAIVSDYAESLPEDRLDHLEREIGRGKNSLYTGDMASKYGAELPVWVLLELVSFGGFVSFYKYCAEQRFGAGDAAAIRQEGCRNALGMRSAAHMLMTVQRIRNAAAHNNCLLNDLSAKTTYRLDYHLQAELRKIGLNPKQRKKKMSCERVNQIVTCLYLHSRFASADSSAHMAVRLRELKARFFREFDYSSSPRVRTTFEVIGKAIDGWLPAPPAENPLDNSP